jgi:DNA-binding SARP family transcriptional activator/tetratricopeptide (TPR) repeat protein
MTSLSVRLLGGFDVKLDCVPVDGFQTRKTQALLAYLATESDRPHTRTFLGGLLWPEYAEDVARTYLRRALSDLRTVLDDRQRGRPYLSTSRESIQFNLLSTCWLDVAALREGLTTGQSNDNRSHVHAATVEALDLYRGRFLEGFDLRGCTAFEEWQLLTAETIQRQVVEALSTLAEQREVDGDYSAALRVAWRCAELEPLSDEANRRVIRLLAVRGDSSAALVHYRRFAELLVDELEMMPTTETQQLADQIAAGRTVHRINLGEAPDTALPPFLPDAVQTRTPKPFVARMAELAMLHEHLEAAIAGTGRITFVAGDAGQGKTSLIQAFARQALARHVDLVVACGRCTSFRGIGDPYLPFREILAQMSGDFITQWEAGDINREWTRRLWQTAPFTIDVMLAQSPDLIGTLVPATDLSTRATAMPACTDRREKLARFQGQGTAMPVAGAHQHALFEQCTRLLQTIARERPLLFLLEDLHWADLGSMALLFHLGQRILASPLLIVGSYRPEEVALGRENGPHPLEPIIAEFQQRYGSITIDLNDAEGRDFTDEYLDLEPNQLEEDFRSKLLDVCGGHPLYTVELLQDMRATGTLTQDSSGRWIQHADLDWYTLPARVEAAIGQRIERLPSELRTVLDVAAVEGDSFCVDVIASVMGEPARDAMRMLRELERRHHLVAPHGSRRLGERRLVDFRFAHTLFREYVLGHLDHEARSGLNEAVATSLESIYADYREARSAIAGRLSWHFEEADLAARAVPYCAEAGEAALQLVAYDEAGAHFQHGLTLLDSLPPSSDRDRVELRLLIGMGVVRCVVEGPAAPLQERTWRRAMQLSDAIGDPYWHLQVSRYAWETYLLRGDMRTASKLAETCLQIAKETGSHLLESYVALIASLCRQGEMVRSRRHFEAALPLCSKRDNVRPAHLHAEDQEVGVLANGAIVLWYLGYPDRARTISAKSIAVAQALNHPYSIAFATSFCAALHQRAGMPIEAERLARRAMAVSAEHGFALWSTHGDLYCGWAKALQGELAAGLRRTRDGLAGIRRIGMQPVRQSAVLADVYLRCGQIEAGLSTVEMLLATVERTDEREWEPELHRLRGELLLAQQAECKAVERCFEQAVAVAAAQQSKSLELRATISLSRLLQAQGRTDEARKRLVAIHDWFEEGFDTPDLQAAAEMLEKAD